MEGAIFPFAECFIDVEGPFEVRINDGDLGDGGAPWSKCPCIQSEDFGGSRTESADGF